MQNQDKIEITTSLSRLRAGSSWALLGKVFSILASFVVTALLARLLPPEHMGLYFLAVSVVTAGSIFGQIGLDMASIRFVSQSMALGDVALCKKYIVTILFIGISASLAVAVLLNSGIGQYAIKTVLKADLLLDSLFWLSVWVVAVVTETIVANIFRGFHDIKLAIFLGGLLRNIIYSILLSLAALGILSEAALSLHSVIIIAFICALSSSTLGILLLGNKIKNFDSKEISVAPILLQTSLPMFMNALLLYVITQSNLWIIGAHGSKEEVAIYGAAMRLVFLLSVSLTIINAVVPPMISEKHVLGKLHTIEKLLRAATTVCGIPAVLLLLIYIFAAEWILGFVFGEYYLAAANILIILSCGELFKVLTGPCGVALNMTGNQTVLMRLSIVRAIFCVIGSLIVVRDYGVLGVALVYSICLVLHDIAAVILVKKRLGIWTFAGIAGVPSLFSRLG